jgi:hypothetical protein
MTLLRWSLKKLLIRAESRMVIKEAEGGRTGGWGEDGEMLVKDHKILVRQE